MSDSIEIRSVVENSEEAVAQPIRRPWQTPRVILASVAEAEHQANGGTDGIVSASSHS
jgi:hypothetical protein